jgi:hypothetical protein
MTGEVGPMRVGLFGPRGLIQFLKPVPVIMTVTVPFP